MWCLPCFKPPSTPEDLEFDLALQVSREEEEEEEAVIEEAKHLSYALQESSRLHQRQEAEQKSRARELEKDAQIALAFQYHETEMHNNSVLDKGKIKQLEEQVKKDEELALILHESLNMLEPPPRIEERKSIPPRAALLDVEEQLAKESLKEEKGKGKLIEGEQVKNDEELALILHESLNMVEPPPCSIEEERKSIPRRAALDVEEHLAKAVKESLKDESLIKGKGKIKEFIDGVEEYGKLPEVNPPRSICRGCNSEIEHGRSVIDVLGVLWHPECLWCDACHKPIAVHEVENHVSNSRGKFHNACYERYCYVCEERKMKKYNHHPFWEERYCPAHDSDGTPKCCSCERLEPKGTNYVLHGDGRWLCLECMESAVMDTDEVQPLYFEIREFFEGLNMKIEKAFPFLLVEKQALNKAQEEEKIDYQYEVVTRGICLSEAQTVTTVSKRPRMGPYNQLIDMVTESQRVARNCEVTAILILYGLPRLMTGYILAHEMMHAYLRLKGYRNLNNVMEEGICQVLGHMWLESQTYAPIDVTEAVASSSHTPAATASKKGVCSDFEKKLVQFSKNQIETDESRVYGVGFREVNKMVTNSSLQETLKEIVRRG